MSTPADPPRSPAADSTDGAQAKAQEVAGRAQDQAQAVAGQAQERLREQVDQRATQAGEQLHGHASDLRSVSQALRDQAKDRPAQAADRLAGYAERAGSYLRDKDADSLLADAEQLGRQKPAAVAAGAVAIGFVAARFLKASSGRRYASGERPRATPASPDRVDAPAAGQPAAASDPAQRAGL